MEKDFESWLHQRQPDTQFPNAKSLKLPFDIGMQNTGIPPCAIPCTNAAPVSGTLPSFGYTGHHDFKVGQSKEPYGWFYCLPRFRQGLVADTTLHDKFLPENGFTGKAAPAAAIENHVETNVSPSDAQRAPKQFLVFDRTGDKTTLILSSMVGAANQPLNSWNQKSTCEYNNVKEGELIGNGSSGQFYSEPNLTDDLDDDNEISEMHEDSEDIDALLSSDDEGCYSDGEETSTGRSPSTMTAYEKQDWYEDNEEDMDEVASSAGPSKRQKLSDSSYEVPSVTYAASYLVPKGSSSEYEDDAESSCAGGQPTRPHESFSGNKRDRKEKIRETVSILQTILPGGDGKDAVVVLDEAINYLKSLRYKAKCLGISGL